MRPDHGIARGGIEGGSPHHDVTGDELTDDERRVWTTMTGVYEAFLSGEPERVDAVMDPDVTIWDSARPEMVHGLDGLRSLRAGRPVGDDDRRVAALDASRPVIDIWGDIALVRHLLRVRYVDPARPDELVRNTSVWHRVGGRWLAVHNHEDVLAGPT